MKILLLFIFLPFLVSAQARIERTKDGRGIRFSGICVHYDASGNIISIEKYRELVNSQKYVVGMNRGEGDTLFFYMTPKDPTCYIGKKIPPMKFQDIRGKSFIAGKKNRITILAFWGDRCAPCIALIDKLDSLALHYKKVSFVAVPTYGDTEKFWARHPWKNVYVPINYKGNYFEYFPEPVLAIIDRYGVLKEMYWNYAFDKVMRFLEDNR